MSFPASSPVPSLFSTTFTSLTIALGPFCFTSPFESISKVYPPYVTVIGKSSPVIPAFGKLFLIFAITFSAVNIPFSS